MSHIADLSTLIALAAGTGSPVFEHFYKDPRVFGFTGTVTAAPTAPVGGRWHD